MIFFFKPTYVFDKVKDITPDFLKKHGIKGLLLDLDNTLTTHNNPVVPQSSLDSIQQPCTESNALCSAAGYRL